MRFFCVNASMCSEMYHGESIGVREGKNQGGQKICARLTKQNFPC